MFFSELSSSTCTRESCYHAEGKAALFLADGQAKPENITFIKLEKEKSYTVPLGIWHAPIMSEDAKIFLVENKNTVESNSPRVGLTEEQIEMVRELGKDFL